MMAAHTVPRPEGLGGPELLVDGRPSLLFALVAGVSLGLMTGADAPAEPRQRPRHRLRLVIRACALIAAGALLWLLPHGIAVILDYYGVMFLLLVPLLFLRRRLLAAVAAGTLVIAPLLRDAVVATGPPEQEPAATVVDYLLTGWYPALLWVPVLAAGLIAARSGLGRSRVRIALVAGGATAAVAGYGAAAILPGLADALGPRAAQLGAVTAEAHSGTAAELLGSGGLAAAIVGLLLMMLDPRPRDLADRASAAAGSPVAQSPTAPSLAAMRLARAALRPLALLGRVALTVYVGHVLVIAALAPLGGAGRFDDAVGWSILVVLVAAGLAIGWACEALGRRGPLEAGLSELSALPLRRARVPD